MSETKEEPEEELTWWQREQETDHNAEPLLSAPERKQLKEELVRRKQFYNDITPATTPEEEIKLIESLRDLKDAGFKFTPQQKLIYELYHDIRVCEGILFQNIMPSHKAGIEACMRLYYQRIYLFSKILQEISNRTPYWLSDWLLFDSSGAQGTDIERKWKRVRDTEKERLDLQELRIIFDNHAVNDKIQYESLRAVLGEVDPEDLGLYDILPDETFESLSYDDYLRLFKRKNLATLTSRPPLKRQNNGGGDSSSSSGGQLTYVDRIYWSRRVRANPRALLNTPAQIRENVDFVRAAVLRDDRALEYAPEEVQNVINREREAEQEANKRKQQYSEDDDSEDDESEDDDSVNSVNSLKDPENSLGPFGPFEDPFGSEYENSKEDLKLRF